MKNLLRVAALTAALFSSLPAFAASLFWIGGTGTLDMATDSAHWSATTGGATCSCEPASGDDITFDASSGGGIVTVNANFTVNSLTAGAFTGTLDFSANNNSPTFVSTVSTGVNFSGSGTRTINLGSGTWTLSGAGATWLNSAVTNETLSAASSTISFTGSGSNPRVFTGGLNKIYGTVSFGADAAKSSNISSTGTIATLNITGPNYIQITAGATVTITNAPNLAGTSGNEIFISSATVNSAAILHLSAAGTAAWAAFRDITVNTNTLTATNSFDLGGNSGTLTITAPSGGGGGGGKCVGC